MGYESMDHLDQLEAQSVFILSLSPSHFFPTFPSLLFQGNNSPCLPDQDRQPNG